MVEKYILSILLIFVTLISIECENPRKFNAVVRINNMTESMKEDAIRITKQAFVKHNGYSTKSRSLIAQYIRTQFDHLYKPSWQCILGRDYALSITTENEKRIILDVDKVAVLIFKGKC